MGGRKAAAGAGMPEVLSGWNSLDVGGLARAAVGKVG